MTGRAFDKLIVVTRKTRLRLLEERYSTREQARFLFKMAAGHRATRGGRPAHDEFADFVAEDDAYRAAIDVLRQELEIGLKVQWIDRSFVPSFLFSGHDIIVTLGQDGLVANVAKYAGTQPIIAVNPDPPRFDGILMPFSVSQAAQAAKHVVRGDAHYREVTLAEARLDNGLVMRAFNELFIGARSHVSARYRIQSHGKSEHHSSSGVLVSTGAGSTGWLSSVYNMARAVAGQANSAGAPTAWEDPRLTYVVREPFVSKTSSAAIVFGRIEPGDNLQIESMMPSEGVIFSDGVEADFNEFPAGRLATIGAADHKVQLVVRDDAMSAKKLRRRK
ncbi:NAD(+)/NADH kinase [soil metagenome]